MDFLLECIGFPPDWDLDRVMGEVRARGSAAPWRESSGQHLSLPIAGGLELRLDHDEGYEPGLWPFYSSRYRCRVGVTSLHMVPDSNYDAVLLGKTNPIAPIEHEAGDWRIDDLDDSNDLDGDANVSHPIAACLTDARRLPRSLPMGHVLAVNVAGFALSIDYVGPNEGGSVPGVVDRPHGASIEVLGGDANPAACMELSMRVRSISHLRNEITGERINRIELDAPGNPLEVFVSPWQLELDGLPHPKPGSRIEGVFLLLGRIVGGLPRTPKKRRVAFG
ncbi:MAG: hypothetical protein ACJAZ8_001994 [Planctomycetota bacterium]